MSRATPLAASPPPRRPISPNRRREVGRMVFWNLVLAAAVVTLPILL